MALSYLNDVIGHSKGILSAAPSIDALCHDRRAYIRLLAPGNSIEPNCTKFGPYINYMV